MSMHKKHLTKLEREGLKAHALPIAEPSQLSDSFRHGVAWAMTRGLEQDPVAVWLKSSNPERAADLVAFGNPAHIYAGIYDQKVPLYEWPQPALKVWYGSMPESNGKTNWTAILHAGDVSRGITIDRSEYPDRVRYQADRMRYLIGEIAEEPDILEYDADKHSGYKAAAVEHNKVPVSADALYRVLAALCGSGHLIRELQVTRSPTELFPDNPINLLIAEYEAWAAVQVER